MSRSRKQLAGKEDQIRDSIAENLTRIREDMGLNVRKASSKLRLPISSLWNYEATGKNSIPADRLVVICAGYGLSLNAVIESRWRVDGSNDADVFADPAFHKLARRLRRLPPRRRTRVLQTLAGLFDATQT